jgi:hypothetical protein
MPEPGDGQRLDPVIRPARPGGGPGCARVWTDAGRNFREIDPRALKLPEPDGLTGWFTLARDRKP